jgi:hypothetical protein
MSSSQKPLDNMAGLETAGAGIELQGIGLIGEPRSDNRSAGNKVPLFLDLRLKGVEGD